MTNLRLGFNDYMTDEVYHGDKEYLSSSVLKDILKKPDEVRLKRLGLIENESKSYFILGQYIHWKWLEPEREDAGFAVFNGARRYGKIYDQFLEENEGRSILLKEEENVGNKAIEVLNKHKIASTLNIGGTAEQTICGIINDVKIKVRADYLKDNAIIDLKTTSGSIDSDSIRSTIFKYGYHISAALYVDVANMHTDTEITEFILVFINKKNFEIGVCKIGKNLLQLGREEYLRAIEKYKKLDAEGFFSAEYEPGIIEIDL